MPNVRLLAVVMALACGATSSAPRPATAGGQQDRAAGDVDALASLVALDSHLETLARQVAPSVVQVIASGYAAVWAEENTREAIFDAMERKEVYGTTGSRIANVRFMIEPVA